MDVVAAIEAGTITVVTSIGATPPASGEIVEAMASNGWAFYLAEEEGAWLLDSLQTGDGAELSDEAIRGEHDPAPMPQLAGYRLDTPEKRARWNLILITATGGTA